MRGQAELVLDVRPQHGLRALVVDDHRAFAQAIGARLRGHDRFDSVEVAYSAVHALAIVGSRDLDVVLLDADLGDASGLDVLRHAKASGRDVVFVVLSGLDDLEEVIAALSDGAQAWVPKDVSLDELLESIDDALLGRVWLPRELLGPVLDRLMSRPLAPRPRSFVDELTPRQLEVMECLANGMSRAQIAERLVLSPHTVRTHVQEVLRKAGAHSTLAALALARDAGHFLGRTGS